MSQQVSQIESTAKSAPKSNLLALALAARAGKVAAKEAKVASGEDSKTAAAKKIVQDAVKYITTKALEAAGVAAARGHGYTRVPTPGSQDQYVFHLPGTKEIQDDEGQKVLVQLNPEATVYFSGYEADGGLKNPCEAGLPWIGIFQGFRPKGQPKADPVPSSVPGGRTVIDLANEVLSAEGVRIDLTFSGKDRGVILTAIWEEEAWEQRQRAVARKQADHMAHRGHREARHEDRRPHREAPRLGDFIN